MEKRTDFRTGRPPLDRVPIIECLQKRPLMGATIREVAAATGLDFQTCEFILRGMRKLGQVGSVKVGIRVMYFSNTEAADEARPALLEAQQRVRAARREAAKPKPPQPVVVSVPKPPRYSQAAERAAKSFEKLPPEPQPEPAAKPASKPRFKAPPAPPVVVFPAGVKRVVIPMRRELADRFGASDPAATVPGGFREEFQRLRAGGASS